MVPPHRIQPLEPLPSAESPRPRATLRAAMQVEHAELDHRLGALIAAYERGSVDEAAARWSELDSALEQHFQLEERQLLPLLRKTHPDEAIQLRHEHDDLRNKVVALNIGVGLDCARSDLVNQFATALRAHTAREDALLHRWADEALSAPERRALRAKLFAAFVPVLR